jgi:hypothetical protein
VSYPGILTVLILNLDVLLYIVISIVFQESVQAAIAHVIAIIWYYNILCKESNTSYMLLCVCSRNSGKGQAQWHSNGNIQSVLYWPIL